MKKLFVIMMFVVLMFSNVIFINAIGEEYEVNQIHGLDATMDVARYLLDDGAYSVVIRFIMEDGSSGPVVALSQDEVTLILSDDIVEFEPFANVHWTNLTIVWLDGRPLPIQIEVIHHCPNTGRIFAGLVNRSSYIPRTSTSYWITFTGWIPQVSQQ